MPNPGIPSSQIPPGEDWLVRRVADVERALRELGPSVARSFAPVIADLTAKQATLDANVASIAAQQATLTSQQATLTSQQADLAAKQVAIDANLASINSLIGQQVTGTAGNATTAGPVTMTTSAASYAAITINVPTGYTVAAVAANTAAASAGSGSLRICTRIAGSDGPVMSIAIGSSFAGNGASNFSRVFSVTSGGTFTVETRAYLASDTGSALLTTAASVTFYR